MKNKQLESKKYDLTEDVQHKENEFRTKDKLQVNSNYALVHYLTELKKNEINVKLVSL